MAAQQNNAKTTSNANTNMPNETTTPLGVQTDVAVTAESYEYFKKFTSLNPGAEPLPEGDGTIRISPFDDYIIFTLFDETGNDGELADTPIDLSNVGTLTLVFIGETDEIRIPNWTQVQEVDLSQGQVLFRISKEDSKKILALDNNIFYVSTRMENESGVSDESAIYSGTFLSLQDSVQKNMTDRLNRQAAIYAADMAGKQRIIDNYETELREMISLDEDQTATIAGLEASNLQLTNELALLSEQLGSTESELALKTSKLIAQSLERLKRKRSQIFAIQKNAKAQASKAKSISFYKQAAKLNEDFVSTANPVYDPEPGKGVLIDPDYNPNQGSDFLNK